MTAIERSQRELIDLPDEPALLSRRMIDGAEWFCSSLGVYGDRYQSSWRLFENIGKPMDRHETIIVVSEGIFHAG